MNGNQALLYICSEWGLKYQKVGGGGGGFVVVLGVIFASNGIFRA